MLYLEGQVGGASVFVIVFTPAESTRNIENICIQCNPTALHLTWSLWEKLRCSAWTSGWTPLPHRGWLRNTQSILQYLHFMIIFEVVVHLSLCSGLQCSCPRYCVCHLYVPTLCRVTWIYIQCIIVSMPRAFNRIQAQTNTGTECSCKKNYCSLANAPQYTTILISKNSRVLQLWLNH